MTCWVNIPFIGILLTGLFITAIGLFGNVIIFGAVLIYAFVTGFSAVGISDLLVVGLLYGFGELLEYIFTLFGVRLLGASKISSWMAVLGAMIGAMFGSIVCGIGVIAGGFLGAFLGAFITEVIIKNNIGQALKAGLGAFVGRTTAIFAKLAIAVIIIIYIIRKIYACCDVL